MRRIVTFLSAGLLVLSMLLAGCGATPTDDATVGDAAQTPETVTAPNTTDTSTTTSSNKAPITVAVVTSLTGSLAATGRQVEAGVKMAAADWQSKTGQEVKVIVEDDTSTNDGAKAAFAKVLAQRPAAIFAPNVTDAVSAIGEANKNPQVPVFFCNGGDKVMQNTDNWYLRICTSSDEWTYLAAEYAVKGMNAKKPAVFNVSESNAKLFGDHFAKLGVTPAINVVIKTDADIPAALNKAKEAGADLIFASTITPVGAKISLAAKQMNLNIPILGTGGFATEDYAKLVGSAKEGVNTIAFAIFGYDQDSKWFSDKVTAAFPGVQIAHYIGFYYDGATMLFNAVQKAGTTDPNKVRETLLGTKNFKGVIGSYTFNAAGYSKHEMQVGVWQGDTLKTVKTVTASN